MIRKTALRSMILGAIATPLVGCGGEDTIQLKADQIVSERAKPGPSNGGPVAGGQAGGPADRPGQVVGRPENPDVRANDDKVESQERGNTPTSSSLKGR